VRAEDQVVPGAVVLGPPVVLDRPADAGALGVPQHQAGADLVGHGKQVQLAADLAVVAALGLFQPREVRFQRVLGGERGAVDPLEHLVVLVATPVGPRDRHQLEVRHGRGGRQVGSFAEVDEIALAVQAHGRVGDALDDLDLVRLAALAKEADRLGLGQILALDRLRGAGQLTHRRLDLLEIVRGEGAVELEIVIEAVLDRRADRQLGAGEEPFDRLGHQVRGAVAEDLAAVGRVERQRLDGGVAGQRRAQVARPPVHLEPDRSRPGRGVQALDDGERGHTARVSLLGPVRERQGNLSRHLPARGASSKQHT
jgi:hypothetical protein